ncbi:MAG: amidohydrolase family protein [Candidatus Sumerlaeia bacterium]|nr:amidohydrolase family protein [Candidatus Sumerlaeia bacterium]
MHSHSGIIDFHAHAFPDALAEKAIKLLEEEGKIRACLDGKISSLLKSMDRWGIEKSIICCIATKPTQFDSIFSWCQTIQSERIIPFPSLHPADTKFRERILQIKNAGFKGIKLHPYYQDFDIDEERLFPIYNEICDQNLLLVLHTGYDFAFPRIPRADPLKILKLKERFPELKVITTHLGSWDDWGAVEKYLIGKEIYTEISFSLDYLPPELAKKMILSHPKHCILFGTDSPWTDQGKTLALLKNLALGEELERLILRDNAIALLNSV